MEATLGVSPGENSWSDLHVHLGRQFAQWVDLRGDRKPLMRRRCRVEEVGARWVRPIEMIRSIDEKEIEWSRILR